MNGPMIGVYGIAIMFLALFLLRIPAAFVMAMVGFVGIAVLRSFDTACNMVGSEMWTIFSNYGLTVIPMFILVGEFLQYAGYSDDLYHSTYKWFGNYRGGLAMTTIMASAGFSAICGSNTATAATMSAVAIPAMKKYKYHPILNAGAVAAGSTLGVMIPPSIVLVVYGLYTSQSIGKLFFGNVIPSAILTVLIGLTVFLICTKHPEWGPRGEKTTWAEKFKALPLALDIFILFAVIMGALLTGMVTTTEAAALSCSLGLAICLLRRKLSWPGFKKSLIDTLRISCLVFMILAGATIFGRFLTMTMLPQAISDWISQLAMPGWMVLWVILIVYIIGGCIMDALAFLLLSLPILFPVVQNLGYDPIWYGQIITIVTTMGAIMPPIGICCYVVAGMSDDIPISTVFKGALYYIPAYIIAIIILMLSPYWTVMVLSDLVK